VWKRINKSFEEAATCKVIPVTRGNSVDRPALPNLFKNTAVDTLTL
jgi:hypothetical protein